MKKIKTNYNIFNKKDLNLLEKAPEPVKRFEFSDINKTFVVVLIILFGFGFFYLFNNFTGLTVYDDNIISLDINDYVSKDALVFLNVNLEEYNKSINEFGLELVNNSYYISSLDVDINDFDLDIENGSYICIVSLVDNGSLLGIKSKEIRVGVEEEVVNISNVTLQEEIIEEYIENVTLQENITLENITIENITLENITNVSLEFVYDIKVELVEPIIINKNVKWRKTIRLNESSNNLTVEIPKEAFNLSVKKIVNDEVVEVKEEDIKVIDDKIIKNVADINLISGYAVYDEIEERNISLVIEKNVKEVRIEYETPGPVSSEEIINDKKKIVTINSDIHYEKVIAYTSINDINKERIDLYWLVNDSRVIVSDVKYSDDNNNSLVDRIEWIVPYLSNQTYEVSITILNVQSYPTVGGNWTVMFNTTGEADLWIRAVNGTTWSNVNENNDLKFLEVRCGENVLDYEWVNDGVYISNYSCNSTSYEISKVISAGKHTLEFEFGGEKAYARNEATISDCQTLGTDNEYYTLDSDTTANYDDNCFPVTGSNITLDCAGHTIDGNADADGYGVIINNAAYDGLTIKNCIIQEFARNLYVGPSSDNIRIENSSLINGYYDGMLTYSTENMYIVNSSFSGVNEFGAYIWYSGTDYNNNNWTIINSTFTGGNTNSDYGLRGRYLYNGTFEYNTFQGGSGASHGYAFYVDAGVDGSIFKNNSFIGGSTSNYDRALYLRNCDDIVVDNNTFLSQKAGYAAVDVAYCDNSVWRNNNITHLLNNYGFIIQDSKNITFASNKVYSYSSVGLRFHIVNNSIIENNSAISGTSWGLYFLDYNNHNQFRNNDISGRYAMYHRYSDYNNFENNNITSSTYSSGYSYIQYGDYNNYTNNNFTSLGSSYGMWLRYSNNDNIFQNNIFYSVSSYGAYIREDNMRNNFTWNSFDSGSSFGARFYDNNDNNIIYFNNFSSGSSWPFYFDNDNDNNLFYRNNFTGNSVGAAYIATRSDNNTFNNNTFISGTTADDDGLTIAGGSNNNHIFNSTIIGDRFGVYLSNSDGNIIEYNIINGTNAGGSNADADGFYIYFTPKVNIIKNNVVGAYRFPVYMLYGAQYNNITNNDFTSETADFRLYTSCDYNIIENNTIRSGNANGDFGFYIYTSNGNTIRNNNITSGDIGFYLYSSSNNVIDDNNVSVANIAGSYGVYLYMFSNNNNFTNNRILAQGDDNIRIQASLGNLVKNNTLCNSDDYGIYISEGSEGNEIRENNVCDNTDDGIYILSSNDNKIISNNISGNTNGITSVDSLRNKITGNVIRDNSAAGLNLGDEATGSTILEDGELIDNVISNSGTNDIVLDTSNIVAINLTYDESKVSLNTDSSATFRWWVDVNVSDTIAQVPNATVKIYDNTGALIDSRITNSNGYISKFNLTEYYEDSDGRTYYSNYTVNTSATNYFDLGVSYNITTNTIINITLTESLPPVLRSISLSPSTDDDIDPNVEINVTANVTDYIAVDTVILQYKENNNTKWINSSNMIYDSNTGLYSNGLFTPNNNDTWNYRIWANDTDSNSNFSISYDVDVQYDYSWNRTPSDFGTVIGVLNTVGTIGNITINNTGDFDITIDLSSTWDDTVYNITEPFVIEPKEVINVGINITFDNSITDINSKITIDASSEQQPNPLQLNTSVVISSYTGGPYLELTLPTYPSVATQTSLQTLKAKIQNLAKYESETIYNITLNWSLPEGWSILSGNISVNFTNLTAQSIDYANLSVIIGTSAPYDINGTNTTISVSALSDSNTDDALSVNVVLLCNGADGVCGEGCWDDVDADCVGVTSPPTSGGGTASSTGGGGGGGGGGGVSSSRALKLKESTQTVSILKGQSSHFTIDIENIYPSSVLKNVDIGIKGFLKQYISIEPKNILEVGYKEKGQFIINIDVPNYLSFGTYQLEATISGDLIKGSSSQKLTEKKVITLIVHEITSEVALESLSLGSQIVKDMKEDGFSVILISKLLNDANIAYENKQYKKAKDIINIIIEKKDAAYEAKELIEDIENRINNAKKEGLDVSTTQKLLDIALSEFAREDYVKAVKTLKEAQLTELLETKGRVNILKFIFNHWWKIIISMFFLSIIIIVIYKKLYLWIVSYKIMYLGKEERNIIDLIKDAQKKYYVKKEIGYDNFSNTIRQYNLNLTRIRQKRLELTSKKSAMLTIKNALRNLKKEKDRVLKAIKSCQLRYFVKKILSMSKYRVEIELNTERLAEIDKNIEILNAKLEKEKLSKTFLIKNKILETLSKLSEISFRRKKITNKEEKEIKLKTIKELKKRKIKNKIEKIVEKELKKIKRVKRHNKRKFKRKKKHNKKESKRRKKYNKKEVKRRKKYVKKG